MTERKPAPRKPRARKTGASAGAKKPRSLGKADKPFKVLARVHAYPPTHNAGAEWMLHSLLRALVERGHEVTVSLSRYTVQREPYTLDGVRVVPLAADLDLAAEVRRSRVVVSHLENVPSAGALARGFGSRFVVIGHNTFAKSFQDAANAALVVYNSDWMIEQADAYYESHQPAPGRTIRVSPSVLADDYRTTPGDAITLVNLNEAKGGHLFWELAKRMPDHKFLGVRGAYGEQVVPQRIPDNVEILDHVSGHEMRDAVYARTRVLLMPSAHESWGRVAVELLAAGIPVVAASTPGLSECLAEAGIFAERDDVDAWVEALTALTDPAQWAEASERALARSKALDPAADLAAWCSAVEELTAKG